MDIFANSKTLGELIRNYRKKGGYTLVELGEEIDVTHAYLSKIENNKATPKKEILQKISKVLDADGKENLLNKLIAISGNTHEVEKDSEIYKGLKKQGRIFEDSLGRIKVLDQPYQKLNYILENDSPVIYDLKKDMYGENLYTIQLPTYLSNRIYRTVNKMIFEEIVQNPALLKSIDNEDVLDEYSRQKDINTWEVSKVIQGISFDDLNDILGTNITKQTLANLITLRNSELKTDSNKEG